MHTAPPLYRRHHFPTEIISHTVWLYFRFALSYRDVEKIMRVSGVALTYAAIREWSLKFGQTYANEQRCWRPRPGDKWHLDEIFIKINGKDHYLLSRGQDEIGKRAQEAVPIARNNATVREAVSDTRRVFADALRRRVGLTTYQAIQAALRTREARSDFVRFSNAKIVQLKRRRAGCWSWRRLTFRMSKTDAEGLSRSSKIASPGKRLTS